ncbi:cytochrome c oxidase subunit II [Haloarchaeobius sp. DFWS5]|uniref:cytochrome c oxidase subunit II n=1 Tax=Haloarchaeobius sp. DFWS5 TaxID=3446114 RepID=UPI003EBB3EF3
MYGELPLQTGGADGLFPRGTRVEIFDEIFIVFLALGTLVGVVVLGYMVWNAYKYRDHEGRGERDEYEEGRPILGEVPTGGGHGRKLLLSFSISAIIVLSLILWTYTALLFVESPPTAAASPSDPDAAEEMRVNVTGYQFGWKFEYENGVTTDGTLRVPADQRVRLVVTSSDVFHNFGVPALRTKTDAIPGQTTETWFGPVETGTYQAVCYELCGAGHSYMTGEVVVMEPEAFEQWYANQSAESENQSGNQTENGSSSGNATTTTTGSEDLSRPGDIAATSSIAHVNADLQARAFSA